MNRRVAMKTAYRNWYGKTIVPIKKFIKKNFFYGSYYIDCGYVLRQTVFTSLNVDELQGTDLYDPRGGIGSCSFLHCNPSPVKKDVADFAIYFYKKTGYFYRLAEHMENLFSTLGTNWSTSQVQVWVDYIDLLEETFTQYNRPELRSLIIPEEFQKNKEIMLKFLNRENGEELSKRLRLSNVSKDSKRYQIYL